MEPNQKSYCCCLLSLHCSQQEVDHFRMLELQHDIKGQLKLLESKRCSLLAQIHTLQKELDCLDYMIEQKRKEL